MSDLQRLTLWQDFCERYNVVGDGAPLFDTADGYLVRTRAVGRRAKRQVLCRSEAMERLVIDETQKVIADFDASTETLDGVIYVMYVVRDEMPVPLYIGKAEKYGRGNQNLSANLTNLERDKGKFARWGDGYAYHIGDLSALVLPGHPPAKAVNKYKRWADKLFESYPTTTPRLREPVHLWAHAWSPRNAGIWREFGETSLSFLEYTLIGVASSVFPEDVLNTEGKSRASQH